MLDYLLHKTDSNPSFNPYANLGSKAVFKAMEPDQTWRLPTVCHEVDYARTDSKNSQRPCFHESLAYALFSDVQQLGQGTHLEIGAAFNHDQQRKVNFKQTRSYKVPTTAPTKANPSTAHFQAPIFGASYTVNPAADDLPRSGCLPSTIYPDALPLLLRSCAAPVTHPCTYSKSLKVPLNAQYQ